ncbi:MAG: iron-containing alcohol dehydrogenase, partial [Rickettsiales bacterium]|nr:iron-containing alcohol dehydrogenase [Rickettsiales bacterium]
LTNAPMRLIHSGLGDSLCRTTAQTDWLLSHLLFNTPYSAVPFQLLMETESRVFSRAETLAQRDTRAIEDLSALLILSGLGMFFAGGSQPASQGEHLIAHAIEAIFPALPETYHGEQIGVTTLFMSRLQHHLLDAGPWALPPYQADTRLFERLLPAETAKHCQMEFQEKAYDSQESAAVTQYLQENWVDFRHQLQKTMLPTSTLENVLKAACAPATPEALGWKAEDFHHACRHAMLLRNRFTFLDIARLTENWG